MENKKSTIITNFYFQFLGLFILVSILILLIQYLNKAYLSNMVWYIQGFYFIVGNLNHLISGKGLKNAPDMHLYYMASMSFRFFLSLIFLFVAIYNMNEGHFIFVINFFILYFVYTSFEIYYLLRNLRPDFKTNGTVDKKV